MAKGNGRPDSGRHKVTNEMLACLSSLKAFAISLSGNEVRAEDLVQQTVLLGLANLDKFQPGTNMSAWLFTILRNRFHSDWRKLKREQDWNPEFEDALTFSTGLGDGGAEAKYDFHRLLMYLVCLPAEQSDALIAIGYLGMSYEDAAERLGCAIGTIKSRVNRARTELATLMQGAILKEVRLAKLKAATKGFPKSHPYYPIAQAYEELYASCEEVSEQTNGKSNVKGHAEPRALSDSERAWQELVASGALDNDTDNLDVLIRGTQDDS